MKQYERQYNNNNGNLETDSNIEKNQAKTNKPQILRLDKIMQGTIETNAFIEQQKYNSNEQQTLEVPDITRSKPFDPIYDAIDQNNKMSEIYIKTYSAEILKSEEKQAAIHNSIIDQTKFSQDILNEIESINIKSLKKEIKLFAHNAYETTGGSSKKYISDMQKILPHYRNFRDYIKKDGNIIQSEAIESYNTLKNLYESGEIGNTARKRIDKIFKNFARPTGYNVMKW